MRHCSQYGIPLRGGTKTLGPGNYSSTLASLLVTRSPAGAACQNALHVVPRCHPTANNLTRLISASCALQPFLSRVVSAQCSDDWSSGEFAESQSARTHILRTSTGKNSGLYIR